MNSSNEFEVAAAANHIHRLGINDLGSNVNLNTIRLVDKELPTLLVPMAPGAGFTRIDNILGVDLHTPGDPNGGVTDPMGLRVDPITKIPGKWHYGVDIGSPLGTPIGFPTEGRAVDIKLNDEKTPFNPGHGNQIVVQIQNSDYAYSVSHKSAILVTVGQPIQPGQAISLSGNTGRTIGNSGGYHTHMEIYKYNPVDRVWESIRPTQKDLEELQRLVGAGN